MLPIFHVITFVAMLAFMILLLDRQRLEKQGRGMAVLFFMSLAAYVFVLASAEKSMSFRFSTAAGDLLLLAALSAVYLVFSKSQLSRMLYIAVTAMGLAAWYVPDMLLRFSGNPSTVVIESDKKGELLVEIKEGSSLKDLNEVLLKYDIISERAFFPADENATDLDDYYVLDVSDANERFLEDVISKLKKHSAVDWVEENEVVSVNPIIARPPANPTEKRFKVNDPELAQQWALDALGIDKLYELIRSKKIKPKRKARLFILDTGIDSKHEDLSDVYVSHDSKYDNDPKGHGTHCAGIAAAVSNNGIGVASLTPTNDFVQLTSVKVLSAFGTGTQKGIIGGIIEAADNGADVISLSLGGRSSRSRQRAYKQAVSYAARKGAIVVCAAGNSNDDAGQYSPANSPGVITVSAIDDQLNRAPFSNRVNNIKMPMAAPGVAIRSTLPNNKYENYSGTSMATPYVAGIIAIMKSLNPELTTNEAHKILTDTGKKLSAHKELGHLPQPEKAVLEVLKMQ